MNYDLRRVPIHCTDVLVLGSGIAGLSTALEISKSRDVLLVAKAALRETNTAWAQGGIAAVLGIEDSVASHRDDTLNVGQGICELGIVDLVTARGPAALRELAGLGARFDKLPDGTFDLQREGGHSHARVVHAQGDMTGREIERALSERVAANPRISIFEHTAIIDLLTNEDGVCIGAVGWRRDVGMVAFITKNTVLATGGAGWLYRETTNPPIATADGAAMAFRAGAAVRDMEFIQFHPTTLYVAGAGRLLVSEIVRGKGGILVDRTGHRFMFDYHPDGELAPRDVVSRAIVRQMVKTGDTSAYLDLRNIEGDVKKLFPHLAEVCKFFEIDISRDRVPVRPAAHYCVGGVEVDRKGKTTIPGLYAVGEVASSGLHGANRIGSNSLLEGLVFGKIVGEDISNTPDGQSTIPKSSYHRAVQRNSGSIRLDLEDVAYSVRSLMTRLVGVERSAEGLDEAAARLDGWIRYLFSFELDTPRAFEVANIVTVARLVAESARFRKETRGTHYRTDFPERNDSAWRAHSRIITNKDGAAISLQSLNS
ncbi:MAG: L-aspartate oxidase [Planctomycetota bacterium]